MFGARVAARMADFSAVTNVRWCERTCRLGCMQSGATDACSPQTYACAERPEHLAAW